MELKPVTKEEWLAALRSGEFKQARGVLYKGTTKGYCCIGVLGALAGASVPEMAELRSDNLMDVSSEFNDILTSIGLSRTIAVDAAKRNDSGATFAEIADWLEKVLP